MQHPLQVPPFQSLIFWLDRKDEQKGVWIPINTKERKSFHYHRSVSPFYDELGIEGEMQEYA